MHIKDKILKVALKTKKIVIRKKIYVLALALALITFYSMTRIPIDTVAFECIYDDDDYYARERPQRYVFQKFIINKNNDPDDLMPVNFFTYALMSEWHSHLKYHDDCNFGLGVISCHRYIWNDYRKELNKEYDISIEKTQRTESFTIKQVNLDQYDATISIFNYEFNKEEKKYDMNTKGSHRGYCKQTKINF